MNFSLKISMNLGEALVNKQSPELALDAAWTLNEMAGRFVLTHFLHHEQRLIYTPFFIILP